MKVGRKEDLECCNNQGFDKRKSFCFSCGKTRHVLPLTEKDSWSCCNDVEIYNNAESRCCAYGVEKGKQCKWNVYSLRNMHCLALRLIHLVQFRSVWQKMSNIDGKSL